MADTQNGRIGKLYCVRSTNRNVSGSVVEIRWKTEVIGRMYYVRPVNETRGVLFCLGIRYLFVLRYGGREAELERRIGCYRLIGCL